MIAVVATLVIIFFVLLLNEYLWKKSILKGEASRKFIHIIIGVYGAFWPLYLSWVEIQIIALMALLFIILIRLKGLFNSVYAIKRKSWGDMIGPATIIILSLLQPAEWIFAAAVLHIALADGLAAVLGEKYGKKSRYKIVGNTKSVVGTLTFWIVSVIILVFTVILAPSGLSGLSLPILVWLSAGAAYLENISPYGFDNFLVPMLIYAALQPLQLIY